MSGDTPEKTPPITAAQDKDKARKQIIYNYSRNADYPNS